MNRPIRFLYGALIVVALVLVAGARRADAQPPCNGGNLTVINTTPITVTIFLASTPGGPAITAGPFATVNTPVPNPINIFGIRNNIGGAWYPFAANPTAPPPYWVPSKGLIPSGNCFDIYYDPATCTITVKFASVPPCLNP